MNEFSNKIINLHKLFVIKRKKPSDDPVECKRIYNKRYRIKNKTNNPVGRPKIYTDEESKNLQRERSKMYMRKKRQLQKALANN